MLPPHTLAVVAHPKRSPWVTELARAAEAEAISWDHSGVGCEANHLQAWRYLATAPTEWGVVLEDDVILCPQFPSQLRRVLACAPTPVVSLYLGRGYPRGGVTDWQNRIASRIGADVCWLTADALLSCQGYAIRTELITDMVDYVTPLTEVTRPRKGSKKAPAPATPMDEAVSAWCQEKCYLVAHTRPSIVNHRDTTPLITRRADGQGRDKGRVAWLFDNRESWDASTVHLDPVLREVAN